MNIYNITGKFQSNIVLNKGVLDLCGYVIPSTIMANNKIEARERFEKTGLFCAVSFLTPLFLLPLLNRSFFRIYGSNPKFGKNVVQIMQLSKKFLTKDAKYMEEGILALGNTLKTKYKNIDNTFKSLLESYNNKELLRKKLINIHINVLGADFIITGLMLSSILWISNAITRMKTGRKGFSAEFNMADKNYTDRKAEKYEKMQKRNQLITFLSVVCGGLGTAILLKKGLSSTSLNFIKKRASLFDYSEGIFMSRLSCVLIALFADFPATMLASRDKEEYKYNMIRLTGLYSMLFGGDMILNNVAGVLIDKFSNGKIKLVNKTGINSSSSFLRKMIRPLYTFKELNEQTDWNPKVLQRTKKAGLISVLGKFCIALANFGIWYAIYLE